MTTSDLTKVSPRSNSEHSPRHHSDTGDRATLIGQSYVINTELSPNGAHAAGLPIIQDPVLDSCTDVSFTSLDLDHEDYDRVSAGSPIQPIELLTGQSGDWDDRAGSVTSFADIGKSNTPTNLQSQDSSLIGSTGTSSSGLKQRFEQQKNTPLEGTGPN